MEEKLLELLRNFYPTETSSDRNDPTTQRIQELILKRYKKGKNRVFLDEIENKYGEKYRINTFRESSWAPSFGFVMECFNETTTHQVNFYASILAPQYCYFVKSHQKIRKPIPPKDEDEKAFYTKLGGLLDQERRQVFQHLYLDEHLAAKLDTLTEWLAKNTNVLSTWHSTSMYQWLRQHADSYQAYSPRIYINEAPNDLGQELNFILQLQEEFLNFTLLSAHLFETKVHGLVHHYDSGIPTFGKLLFGHSAPDKRIKLL